jgi:acyl dehydratase
VTVSEVWPNGMPAVGQTARRSRTVVPRDIELFTEISGDRNPLHYDETVAQATQFGGIVVQGGVTSAILNAVVAEDLPGPGTVFLQVNWSFKAPVRPRDTITGEVEVRKKCVQTSPLRSSGPALFAMTAPSFSTAMLFATQYRSGHKPKSIFRYFRRGSCALLLIASP